MFCVHYSQRNHITGGISTVPLNSGLGESVQGHTRYVNSNVCTKGALRRPYEQDRSRSCWGLLSTLTHLRTEFVPLCIWPRSIFCEGRRRVFYGNRVPPVTVT